MSVLHSPTHWPKAVEPAICSGLTDAVDEAKVVVIPWGDRTPEMGAEHLIDAVSIIHEAGRPASCTIASARRLTRPSAVDLLRDGAGLIVPHRDAIALAEAIRIFATDRATIDAMSRRARLLTACLSWPVSVRGLAQGCARLSPPLERVAA